MTAAIKLEVAILKLVWFIVSGVFKIIYWLFCKIFNIKTRDPGLEEIYKIHKQNPRKAGYAFEGYILNLFKTKLNYTGDLAMNIKKSGDYPSQFANTKGDGGMDIILFDNSNIVLVQTKFYSKPIDKNIVAETSISHKIFKSHYEKKNDKRNIVAYIVTNSDYDQTAYAYAKEMGINLINGEKLNNIITHAAA